MLLLDTSICIPLINGTDAKLRQRLLEADPSSVVLCSIVKAELQFGARNSERVSENLDRVERFCRAFESLPFDDRAAAHYGGIRVRRAGKPIGANDLLIAAIALAADADLVTRDVDDFRRVPSLRVAAW